MKVVGYNDNIIFSRSSSALMSNAIIIDATATILPLTYLSIEAYTVHLPIQYTTYFFRDNIVISNSEGDIQTCYEEGMDDYCGSPVPIFPSDMVKIMKKACWSPLCDIFAMGENNSAKIGNSLLLLGNKEEQSDVLDLRNAYVESEGDVCINKNEILGSYGCKDKPSITSCIFDPNIAYEKVIVISQLWGYGYFHGMIEGLPRLIASIEYIKKNEPEKLHEWVVHSMLGEPLAREIGVFFGVERFVKGSIYAHRILFSTPTPCGGSLHGGKTRALRDFIRSRLPSNPTSLVLIKRAGTRRSLANHEEVYLELQRVWKIGPVVEHTGEGSFLDQMTLFSSAMVVMGPHGAGLSNAIAMRKGSTMIEIMPEVGANALNMCYAGLAYSLNLNYFALRAPGFDFEGSAVLPLDNEWFSEWLSKIQTVASPN